MLRNAKVGGVEYHGGEAVSEADKGIGECRIENPVEKFRDILDDDDGRSLGLSARYDGPGRGSGRIVMGLLPPTRPRMSGAGGRGEQKVVTGDVVPVGLVKILAEMKRFRMVLGMCLDGKGPVIGAPENLDVRHARAGREAASAGEEVNGCGHAVFSLRRGRSRVAMVERKRHPF